MRAGRAHAGKSIRRPRALHDRCNGPAGRPTTAATTSLPFIVAATAIGVDLGLLDQAESAALIAAGLLSVIAFPLTGVTMLRRGERPE